MQRRNILVVGAGPVGSVAALACARFGHRVTLLDAQERIDDSPRASTTQPPTLEILAQLGLIDEYIAQGLVARTFQFWDRPTRRLIAEFDFSRLRGEAGYPMVVQAELGCCLRTYMADPDEWTNLFKVAGDDLKGRWRAVFNTRPDETDEEALSDDSVRARLARCYAQNADWLHLNLYSVHQRVAKQ